VGGDRRYRVPMTEYLPDYEHRGDPLAKHILTTADQRTQAKAERTAEFIRLIVDNAPPLSREDADEIWRLLPSSPPPRDLMRWRVRLYCGHVVERKAHRTHTTISSALDVGSACPTCGLDPATIVAGVPLGLTSDSTNPQPASAKLEAELARVSRRATAAEREHRDLSAQAVRLRQQLDATRSGSGSDVPRFVASAGGKVVHRRGCRTIRNADDSTGLSMRPHLLEFTARQADEWLRESAHRRQCKTCHPDIEVGALER
jgi:hypothetical protein